MKLRKADRERLEMQNPNCLRCRDDGIYVPVEGQTYRVCSCKEGAAYLSEMRRCGGNVPASRIDTTSIQTLH